MLTKSKINIHSSFLQEELHDGICETQGDDSYTEAKPDVRPLPSEDEGFNPVVFSEEKPNLKTIGPANCIPLTSQTDSIASVVNKNLISMSEDHKGTSSRPSTTSNKTNVQRKKSDVTKESKKRK